MRTSRAKILAAPLPDTQLDDGKSKGPRKPAKKRPQICPITRKQWDDMYNAWRKRPTIQNVMQAGGVGRRIATRAINAGWPDASLPPFSELLKGSPSVHKEMQAYREEWEEAALQKGEAARQAAEEAMAARISMSAALKASRMAQGYAAQVLERLEQGQAHIPEEITPKVIYQIVRSLESSATVVEKAMKVEQMRASKPEEVLGIEIGILLERCTDDELDLIGKSGHLPARIVSQRKAIQSHIGTFDESDAEANALEYNKKQQEQAAEKDLQEGLDDLAADVDLESDGENQNGTDEAA